MRIPEKAQMTHSNKVCQSKEDEHDRRRSANANAIAADLSVCHVHAWPAVSQDSSHQDDIRPGNDNPVCNCVDVSQTSRTLNRVAGTRRKKSHGVKLCSHEFHPSSFSCSSFQSGVHCRIPINSHTHTLHHPQLIENGIFFFSLWKIKGLEKRWLRQNTRQIKDTTVLCRASHCAFASRDLCFL